MTRIAAAILAGGRGERLGGANKALLEISGRTMLERVLAALGAADPILLCAGSNNFPAEIGISPRRRLPDLDTDYAGPLAGVAAAVAHLAGNSGTELLLTVAVDTPFFPEDFASRACAALGDSDGVLAAFAGQAYPTNALWRLSALAALPFELRAGTAPHSLKRLAAARRMVVLDYAGLASEDPFANANTEADLIGLMARYERSPP